MVKRFLLVIFILVFAASCSKTGGNKGNYVAKVGELKITREYVQAELSNVPPTSRQMFMGPDGMARFIDELVKIEGLYLEAKKRGIEQDKGFQKKLEAAKKIAAINYLVEKEIEGIKFTEKDIRDYYDSHKDDFTNRSHVRASRIVVRSDSDAQNVLARLKRGEDFAKVASEVSTDKAAVKTGGDMGFMDRENMSKLEPQIADKVFRLKRGELSDPVTMKDGINIFKVTDIKGDLVGFDMLKDIIPNKMKKAVLNKLMETVRQNHKVEINKDELAKLTPPPAAPAGGPSQGHP